ncbi:hypothetical protein E2562_034289 [Oryza meyeriana var. granulata]|uniref:Uncharacterized protein n=1 Tax=Oryza meyeriana var. granulata TaxID=110450 RepID=A0A6G1DA27_9ORYZ|nr:hypothetical protein E2562_034289 [Oryza meyeriana var. granulata]
MSFTWPSAFSCSVIASQRTLSRVRVVYSLLMQLRVCLRAEHTDLTRASNSLRATSNHSLSSSKVLCSLSRRPSPRALSYISGKAS